MNDGTREALDKWTFRFFEANTASVEAAREDAREKAKIAKRDLELKEEVSELETLKVFSGEATGRV